MRHLFMAVVLSVFAVGQSSAAVVTLDFEGVQDFTPIGSFYSGVSFGSQALALVSGVSGDFENEPSSDTVMGFDTGSATVLMTVLSGFNQFWVDYSTSGEAGIPGISLFASTDGTGSPIASGLSLSNLDVDGTPLSTWFTADSGVLSQTAYSAIFYVPSGEQTIFDDVEFNTVGGSGGQGTVPEPTALGIWALLGMTGLGARWVRRKHKA